MTVIADAKRGVVLPPVKPGDRFEVQLSANGKLVLTPLITRVASSTCGRMKSKFLSV